MPNHFRTIAVLLAFCLALSGCGVIVLPNGDETTAAETTTPSPADTTAPAATTAEPYTAPARPDAQAAADAALAALPEQSFDGASLLIAAASETINPLFPADGELGENQARLTRNAAVTERYGISFIPAAAAADAIYTDALAAQNAGLYYADLLLLPAEQVGRFTAAGLLRNLRNLPFWTADEDSAAVAGSAVYADLGEAVLVQEQLPAVFFNRALAAQLGDDFYTAVEDGSWTWELFFEAAAKAAALEGISGHTLSPSNATRYLDLCAASSGVKLVDNTAGQTPTLTTDAAEALAALDAALRRIGLGESQYPINPANDIEGIQAFSVGRVLFCITSLGYMDWIYDASADWGILPLPSVDGATHTPAGATAPVLCVTANNNKFEMTGLILAALDAASTDVITDAFITERLQNRLRDWQSAGMIERIARSVTYDFAALYGSGLSSLALATTQAVRDVPVSGAALAQIVQARAYAANAELAKWFD